MKYNIISPFLGSVRDKQEICNKKCSLDHKHQFPLNGVMSGRHSIQIGLAIDTLSRESGKSIQFARQVGQSRLHHVRVAAQRRESAWRGSVTTGPSLLFPGREEARVPLGLPVNLLI